MFNALGKNDYLTDKNRELPQSRAEQSFYVPLSYGLDFDPIRLP